MAEQNLIMDVNALLAGTLDDLANKPSWEVFPTGVHICEVSLELKTGIKLDIRDDNGNATGQKFEATAVKVTLKAQQTVQLANPVTENNHQGDKPLNPGDTNTVDLFLTHTSEAAAKNGQGTLKILAQGLNERFGDRNLGDVIAQTKEIVCAVVVKRREYKDKSTKETRYNLVIEQLEVA
jgi:hypothetical protein